MSTHTIIELAGTLGIPSVFAVILIKYILKAIDDLNESIQSLEKSVERMTENVKATNIILMTKSDIKNEPKEVIKNDN